MIPADEIRRNGARNREKRDLEGEDLEIRGAGAGTEGAGGGTEMGVFGSLAIRALRALVSAL